jgi:predicted nucleic acid-binding Zn ribbon protein
MPRAFVPPTECPVCGADVPRGAKACPECGADERSGWDEESTRYDGLDLPASAFEDANKPQSPPRTAPDRTWIAIGVLLVVALILTFVFR